MALLNTEVQVGIGIGIIALTVTEDVVTVGAGVADDPATATIGITTIVSSYAHPKNGSGILDNTDDGLRNHSVKISLNFKV